MKLKPILAATALAAAAVLAPLSQAAVMFSSTFQGATFIITTVDSDTFTFEIQGADALTGDWAGANFLAAFDFKNLGVDFSQLGVSATAIYDPTLPGQSTPGVQAQLNGNLCNTNVGETGSVCFDTDPNIGVAAVMMFQIDITGASLGAGFLDGSVLPHLQIMWSEDGTKTDCKKDPKNKDGPDICNDKKLGSLYSQDIGLSSTSSTSSTSTSGQSSTSGEIPEPSSSGLALFGLGLVGAGFAFRRKSRQV
ncbi:PEP-CTERM sorting domain-containing protein [Aquabacterium humicola]|uniref:PEP-CTERM sorting domain-containing protein n=1 Tax=Aquabacterium humicola TaxID=3237377 RepID=UPI00254366CB|nr:PEP-CTERM sorting domain-containing protein [Rubrivivax pictus]